LVEFLVVNSLVLYLPITGAVVYLVSR
jgi:hypothetical protein